MYLTTVTYIDDMNKCTVIFPLVRGEDDSLAYGTDALVLGIMSVTSVLLNDNSLCAVCAASTACTVPIWRRLYLDILNNISL